MTDRPAEHGHVPGWRFTFVAGFVPLVAGLTILLATWLATVRPDAPYWLVVGELNFTHRSLAEAGSHAAEWIDVNGSVSGVNIVAAAIGVMVASRFGLREGRRWAWWFLAFCFVWVGLHDAVMATKFLVATGVPLLILPYTYCVLMAIGLIRSRRVASPSGRDV
ncbi:hypothetical protein [Microbacterium rhizophilus]|uniref:hypothetical protein n=1 Tax=Microbacterium rhizophilus TaxID=3138934 RepID=UPI0031E9282B